MEDTDMSEHAVICPYCGEVSFIFVYKDEDTSFTFPCPWCHKDMRIKSVRTVTAETP
jgi:predicted RNA-binding Zn-ribbon protein involved in translation (DUF1610 family)